MSNKVLGIVIPVFNKYHFTKACLNDLSKLPSDHEIIIIDNNSTDETQKALEGSSEITYHRNDINHGFAKACNYGYSMSSAANILFLNNDIRVKSDYATWTQPLIEKCSEGLVGPTMGQLNADLKFIKEANEELSGLSYLSGWCVASSKNIWKQFIINGYKGPFSEEFGLAYFEDTDLSFRARQQNIKMQVVQAPVVHFGKQSSKQIDTKLLYSQARNIFVKKWLGNV
jgi:GT2 family glycosyltransferase